MPAPIEVHCPECQATLKLKNRDAEGRKVPCPKCKQPFVIELPADDGLEVIDDFDDNKVTGWEKFDFGTGNGFFKEEDGQFEIGMHQPTGQPFFVAATYTLSLIHI